MPRQTVSKDIQLRSLRKILKENPEVTIRYLDRTGMKQERRVTLHESIVPEAYNTLATDKASPGILKHWDLDKNGVRSLKMDNFLGGWYKD